MSNNLFMSVTKEEKTFIENYSKTLGHRYLSGLFCEGIYLYSKHPDIFNTPLNFSLKTDYQVNNIHLYINDYYATLLKSFPWPNFVRPTEKYGNKIFYDYKNEEFVKLSIQRQFYYFSMHFLSHLKQNKSLSKPIYINDSSHLKTLRGFNLVVEYYFLCSLKYEQVNNMPLLDFCRSFLLFPGEGYNYHRNIRDKYLRIKKIHDLKIKFIVENNNLHLEYTLNS